MKSMFTVAVLAAALLTTPGCETSGIYQPGSTSPVGTWENHGYSEALQFTISTRVTFSSNGEFDVRESIRPLQGASGWIRTFISEQNRKADITYRGLWTREGDIITLELVDRRRYLDDNDVTDIADDLKDTHFWNATSIAGKVDRLSSVSFRMLKDGELLLVTYSGDQSRPPWYAIFFSENKSVLFSRI